VDELTIEPDDPSYAASVSHVQVLPVARLQLSALSESSPLRFKVTDINELPYPGVSVQARVNQGGSLDRSASVSDADGVVEFVWRQQPGLENQVIVGVNGGPSTSITAAIPPAFTANTVVNAASYTPGVVPGGIAVVFGTHLGGSNGRVLLGGKAAQVLFGSDGQLNFLVPADLRGSSVQLTVASGNAASAPVEIPVFAVQPGVFFDAATGYGNVLVAGSGQLTSNRPALAGEYLEIYATGLGSVTSSSTALTETVVRPEVQIAGLPAEVTYSGLAPGFPGVYQINVRVPALSATGVQPLVVTSAGIRSNEVKVELR